MKQRYGLVLLPYPLFMGLANENPTTLTSDDLAGFVDMSWIFFGITINDIPETLGGKLLMMNLFQVTPQCLIGYGSHSNPITLSIHR